MKGYGLVLVLLLTACKERFDAFNLGNYKDQDLIYKNDPELINNPQSDNRILLNPYGETEKWAVVPQNSPSKSPFRLETFHGDDLHFQAENLPLKKTKEIDNDTLFTQIVHCYPAESLFDGELKLTTTASPIKSRDPAYDNYYAKIVLEMPLYSSAEVTRRVDRENQRRIQTAELLANFSDSLARRNQALRMVSLYRTLEKRAQLRIKQGLAMTDEQISFLEKTSMAHADLLKAQSDLLKFRLQLVSLCSDQKAPVLNEVLKRLSADEVVE